MSRYDPVAPSFDRHRAFPDGVEEAIRAAVLAAIEPLSRPRILDLGAGTGRIGWPFVMQGDDYVGVDMSFGMLQEYLKRVYAIGGQAPRLIQADGEALPFNDATFDLVLLMQVVGAVRNWQQFIAEAQRVLRSKGVLIVGHTVMPSNGVDMQMKHCLSSLLAEVAIPSSYMKAGGQRLVWLESRGHTVTPVVAATWVARRTPRGFLERQETGAQFSMLPEPIRQEALRRLKEWAAVRFGSLDAVFDEEHAFELLLLRHEREVGC